MAKSTGQNTCQPAQAQTAASPPSSVGTTSANDLASPSTTPTTVTIYTNDNVVNPRDLEPRKLTSFTLASDKNVKLWVASGDANPGVWLEG